MKLIMAEGLLKKELPTKVEVKSSSVRTIVAFKSGKDCFFVYGFEKNAKSNISKNEEKAIKIIAASLVTYSDEDIMRQMKSGALIEVSDE